MPYATLAQFRARHDRPENPELTQLTALPGWSEPDTDRLSAALDEATGEMDLYIGTRHSLPLGGLTDAQTLYLAGLCADIARYRLWDQRASEEVRNRYRDAIAALRDVAAGRIRLGATADSGTGTSGVVASGAPRRLTRDSLDGLL